MITISEDHPRARQTQSGRQVEYMSKPNGISDKVIAVWMLADNVVPICVPAGGRFEQDVDLRSVANSISSKRERDVHLAIAREVACSRQY